MYMICNTEYNKLYLHARTKLPHKVKKYSIFMYNFFKIYIFIYNL